MAKSYYSFVHQGKLGEVCSPEVGVLQEGTHLYTAANESVLVWDLRTLELVKRLDWEDVVSSLCLAKKTLAGGYKKGQIVVWDKEAGQVSVVLEGHSAAVSALCFAANGLNLYSGSLDTAVIAWDLVSEAAIVKFQGHRHAVTCLHLEGQFLYSGSRDRMVKVWDLLAETCVQSILCSMDVWNLQLYANRLYVAGTEKYVHVWDTEHYTELGAFTRQDPRGRTKVLCALKGHEIFAVGTDHALEIWRRKDAGELEKLLKRRRKRLREKGKDEDELSIVFPDHYQFLVSLRTEDKLVSACFFDRPRAQTGVTAQLAVAYNTNSLQLYSFTLTTNQKKKFVAQLELEASLERPGHRSPARTLSLTSDHSTLASASGESLKLWDLSSFSAVNTIPCSYATCSSFLEGDRFLLLGCKSGVLETFDILSAELVYSVQAHSGAVSSLCRHPQHTLILTGGCDGHVKVWRPSKHFKLKFIEDLPMKDEVLQVKYSPCGRYLAVALVDYTIQVLYSDTKKLCFSLYGHKLPVTCFDISYDSLLLASGAADKNLKLWGLDYGDCHRSLFAHDQALTDLLFVPGTHLLFTASRDSTIKYWDADAFQCIFTLKRHCSEVWKVLMSPTGDFLLSAGNDCSIRIWAQTEEQVFVKEERELALERSARPEDVGLVQRRGEAVPVLLNTEESLTATEDLMATVDLIDSYRVTGVRPPHFGGSSESVYLLRALGRITQMNLETVCHVLPFTYAEKLISYLNDSLKNSQELELTSRVLFILIKVHEDRLKYSSLTDPAVVKTLQDTKESLLRDLAALRTLIGTNIAGCEFISQQVKELN